MHAGSGFYSPLRAPIRRFVFLSPLRFHVRSGIPRLSVVIPYMINCFDNVVLDMLLESESATPLWEQRRLQARIRTFETFQSPLSPMFCTIRALFRV